MANLEKSIARLDTQKKQVNEQFLCATDAAEAMKLHCQLEGISAELTEAEDRWLALQDQQDES